MANIKRAHWSNRILSRKQVRWTLWWISCWRSSLNAMSAPHLYGKIISEWNHFAGWICSRRLTCDRGRFHFVRVDRRKRAFHLQEEIDWRIEELCLSLSLPRFLPSRSQRFSWILISFQSTNTPLCISVRTWLQRFTLHGVFLLFTMNWAHPFSRWCPWWTSRLHCGCNFHPETGFWTGIIALHRVI